MDGSEEDPVPVQVANGDQQMEVTFIPYGEGEIKEIPGVGSVLETTKDGNVVRYSLASNFATSTKGSFPRTTVCENATRSVFVGPDTPAKPPAPTDKVVLDDTGKVRVLVNEQLEDKTYASLDVVPLKPQCFDSSTKDLVAVATEAALQLETEDVAWTYYGSANPLQNMSSISSTNDIYGEYPASSEYLQTTATDEILYMTPAAQDISNPDLDRVESTTVDMLPMPPPPPAPLLHNRSILIQRHPNGVRRQRSESISSLFSSNWPSFFQIEREEPEQIVLMMRSNEVSLDCQTNILFRNRPPPDDVISAWKVFLK